MKDHKYLLTSICFTAAFTLGGCNRSVEDNIERGSHRIEEAACEHLSGNSKVECLTEKAQNRATEAKSDVESSLD